MTRLLQREDESDTAEAAAVVVAPRATKKKLALACRGMTQGFREGERGGGEGESVWLVVLFC